MRKPSIISLMTDFGTKDPYVGVMKGVILGINPYAKIIDLTHEIPPQNIIGAGFFLEKSYRYFPKGTIHVCVVDPGVGGYRNILAAYFDEHYFLLPDNGILSFILKNNNPEEIVSVEKSKYFLKNVSNTFHGRDIFAPLASHMSNGVTLRKLGKKIETRVKMDMPYPEISKTKVKGMVLWMDHFGNIITNIEEKHLKGINKIKIKNRTIKYLSESYASEKEGNLLAVIGSYGNLEVSINKGDAARDLRIKAGDIVEVVKEI